MNGIYSEAEEQAYEQIANTLNLTKDEVMGLCVSHAIKEMEKEAFGRADSCDITLTPIGKSEGVGGLDHKKLKWCAFIGTDDTNDCCAQYNVNSLELAVYISKDPEWLVAAALAVRMWQENLAVCQLERAKDAEDKKSASN